MKSYYGQWGGQFVPETLMPALDELEQLVEKFKYGSRSDPDLLVEVHAYEQARRDLLDRLNDR